MKNKTFLIFASACLAEGLPVSFVMSMSSPAGTSGATGTSDSERQEATARQADANIRNVLFFMVDQNDLTMTSQVWTTSSGISSKANTDSSAASLTDVIVSCLSFIIILYAAAHSSPSLYFPVRRFSSRFHVPR